MAPAVRYAATGDLSIAYQVVGDGPVDLVWVPGFVSHVEILWELPLWRRLLDRLSSFARVVIFDKREQGLSDRTGAPPTLEDIAGDLGAVMDAAGSERATIVGLSEGGPAALLFAASHPQRVSGLALVGSYARLSRAPDNPAGVPAERLRDFVERVVEEWGGPTALALWFGAEEADDPALAEWWARLLRAGTSPGGARALLRLYEELDARPALSSISAPTLVVHGRDDALVPAALGRAVADAIPGARYLELPGPHLPFAVDDGRAFAAAVEELVTGRLAEPDPERVLATVLVTDIVGSTGQATALGDRAWRELLQRHDDASRREFERFRGREVKQTGDGFLATFDGPARAVRCAAAIRDALAPLGLSLRTGVHTGECELRGADVSGIAVHIAARVGAAAGPGEVLVSSTVHDLVIGSGLEFEERGERELAGVPGSWRLFMARV
jgi:class 3 adenylate cyclase/alpha-beta hydrolase superfamily lysophospholipase